MKRFRHDLLLVAVLIVFLFSCSAEARTTLHKDGSGNATLALRLGKPVVDYFLDLAEVSGHSASREGTVIFDLPKIRKRLSGIPGLSITDLRSPEQGDLAVSFKFAEINALIRSQPIPGKKDILAYQPGEENVLRLRLDQQSVRELLTMVLADNIANFDYLFPQKGETRDEYYSNLNFAIENGASLLKSSLITLTITVDGTILRHNGLLQQPSTVRFSLSLAALLFLDKPLEYYIVFR